MICPRCGGTILRGGYFEPTCINCGHAHLTLRELRAARWADQHREKEARMTNYQRSAALAEKREQRRGRGR